MDYYGVRTLKHVSELPCALTQGARPYYIHPSVKCYICVDGWMHVDYSYDERLMVCDYCCNFTVVEKVGRYGISNWPSIDKMEEQSEAVDAILDPYERAGVTFR